MVAGTGEKREYEEFGNDGSAKRSKATGDEPLLKLLVPNYVAGALIGQGGTLMTEMRQKFGGNIRLSANRECYPGTVERIVILTGDIEQIIALNNHIMGKVQEGSSKQPMDGERRDKVKIVLTNAAAGLLIGRGGLTIKGIQEETKAKISICSIETASVPGERVLTMSGTTNERMEACRQIVEKISCDSSNMANTSLKYLNGGIGQNINQDSQMGYAYPNSYSDKPQLKVKVVVETVVPEVMVGGIMGKQGQIIYELSQRSGARFKFSEKNEYAPGTTDRTLKIIAGDINQAQTAFNLINERVEQLEHMMHQNTQ